MRTHWFMPEPGFAGYACYPVAYGRYNDPEHREHRPDGIREYNLHLVFRGQGYVKTDQGAVHLMAGQGFLYAPGQAQHYHADPADPWDVRWIHLQAHDLERLLDLRSPDKVWLFSFSGSERFAALHEQLCQLGGTYESVHEPKLSAVLYELLSQLSRNSESLERTSLLNHQETIRSTADYIRRHCTQPLSLADMAGTAGYSVYYFNRMFKSIMGVPPGRYLLDCRILVAKRMLVDSGLSVKQIASQCGFTHSSYFIRMFRDYIGMTPQQFRLMYTSGRGEERGLT
ncbi:AraC family transcriptional regulator [Paenibacillus sp. F6_3S_P_1C]|uniref:AraC family transcriptional regulator n=1 Tax=Paenibacillus vandeheii TaxID=3035917 RepID=A0ABT8JDT9_9BACL|nr:AraC family transcriptional regulator [Paenibacillus vandeheii]MDN4603275.1 AraC family transcriptional regulator [Paenibacillus vandeheii]